MEASKMKSMIIIKNLPSNIIDEAFVVLKSNKKIKALERIEKEKESNKEKKANTKNYITKEAEMVISNYLSDIENSKKIKSHSMKQLEKKYKRLKTITIILGILTIWGRSRVNKLGTELRRTKRDRLNINDKIKPVPFGSS